MDYGESTMINSKIQQELNKQLNEELYSAYLYLSMSAYFESIDYKGMANWMKVQAQEEMTHAMKFYTYILDRGGIVNLLAIPNPPVSWSSPLEIFESAYQHEQKITSLINDLLTITMEEKDHATSIFLQWFVTEQIEEELSASSIVADIKRLVNTPNSMYLLDKELGQRVFTPPPSNTKGQ